MKRNSIFLATLFTFTAFFLIFTRVSHIECKVSQTDCPPEIQEKIGMLQGSSFFFSNFTEKIEQNKLSDSIYILESVKKKFPNTIEVTLKQEQVAYAVIVNEEIKYIGESGLVLPSQTESKNIVRFDWKNDKQIIIDSTVSPEYHQLFFAVAQTFNQKPLETIHFIWNSDQEILLELPNQPLFIFEKDTIETQVKKVDTIVNAKELEEIAEPILEVDMRFHLPVLRTSR